MTPDEIILAKLAELGDTPDAIAESLRQRDISGVPGDCTECPIANYLGGDVRVFLNSIEDPDFNCIAVPPDAIDLFISKFDEGSYPWLEAGE